MEILLSLFMAYAAIGLILSVTVHILSFFGIAFGGNGIFFALHAGIFPMWLFAVLTLKQMSGGLNIRRSMWKDVLAQCPAWMRYMTYGFFIYAIVNFLIFFVTTALQTKSGSGTPPASVWHGFSGHWMAFYSAGLSVFTAARSQGWDNLRRKCVNGHDVSSTDAFCPACGVKISR